MGDASKFLYETVGAKAKVNVVTQKSNHQILFLGQAAIRDKRISVTFRIVRYEQTPLVEVVVVQA